jgi:hypothetical protein
VQHAQPPGRLEGERVCGVDNLTLGDMNIIVPASHPNLDVSIDATVLAWLVDLPM